MAPRTRGRRSIRATVLVADGFDESQVVGCVSVLRELGIACQLTSLAAGPVTGAHGLTVQPDTSLEAALTGVTADLIVVPGGAACVGALSLDPRVRQLVEALTLNQGLLAVTALAGSAKVGHPLWELAMESVARQAAHQELDVFLKQTLIKVIRSAEAPRLSRR